MRMRMRIKMSLSLSFVILICIVIFIDSYLIFHLSFFFQYNIKLSYYWFNRQEILQRAKERYSKKKTAEYYQQNKEVIKRKVKKLL